MPLPDLIEIVPLAKPVKAEITVPGSKSITNRALILAALADGEVKLTGALWSEDTQIMVACLKELGFLIGVVPDLEEPCNRIITVAGQGGVVPPGGTESEPMELFVGNAGTAARFLAPFLCLGNGVYRLHGVPRMHERPQAALLQALRELGHRVESEDGNDKLPVRIFAGSANRPPETQTEFNQRKLAPASPKKCRVSIEESSQFASALLLSSKVGKWEIEIVGENADESQYVMLTEGLMFAFDHFKNFTYVVEPDASSASYFKAAGWLLAPPSTDALNVVRVIEPSGARLVQMDLAFINFFRFANFIGWVEGDIKTSKVSKISRSSDLADSIMTAIVMIPFADREIQFTDLGRLRVQECERVVALRTELTKCGAKVVEEGDTLTVYPSKPKDLHGAEIETYNDHRMAMCFAILGLKVPGIKIKNPACVKKTFPNFFQKLAAQPPYGLGVEIWGIKNGQRTQLLAGDELFAD
jgi:3-phosphoshikimate 1-carboxyvinyltransferase